MNLHTAIKYLYPTADPLTDYLLMDEGDNKPYIHKWNLPVPIPTQAELEAAYIASLLLPK